MEAPRYIPHYTVDDYEQWEGDWELWRGIAVSMSPSPSANHQLLVTALSAHLFNQLRDSDRCHCRVYPDLDWRISRDTVVRPDISVVCEPVESDFLTRPPSLIVELLSPATAHKDRTAKRNLYAEQGVAHYLMADPDERTAEVLALRGDAYVPISTHKGAAAIELHAGCTVRIDWNDIWKSL